MLTDNEALFCLMSPQQIASLHPEMLQLSLTKLCLATNAASNSDLKKKKKILLTHKNSFEDGQVVSMSDTPVNEMNIHPPSQTTIKFSISCAVRDML